MKYKELVELFRRNQILDELISFIDDFLEHHKKIVFDIFNLQEFVDITKKLTNELINELLDIGMVKYNIYYEKY